jgi:hypothetical protein
LNKIGPSICRIEYPSAFSCFFSASREVNAPDFAISKARSMAVVFGCIAPEYFQLVQWARLSFSIRSWALTGANSLSWYVFFVQLSTTKQPRLINASANFNATLA